MEVESLIKRKLTVTFVTTMIPSMILAYFYISDRIKSAHPHGLGMGFLGWLSIYSMYIGIIVLIYGNLVSVGLEYLQKKWFLNHIWLYVLLHGIFGLANGLLFQEFTLALSGMIVALFYALIDRLLFVRARVQKSFKMFFLFPVALCGLLWGYFQIMSEPLSTFTMEDAVEFATVDNGTVTDVFPKYIGKWEGQIDGYQVERETAVQEIGNEKYLITFTERWNKGAVESFSSFSYEVERGSLTASGREGEEPPYNK
ncbi:hypothetical protein [Bacillus cihuensis]|uniref:hypothetical protein n=1 Tax=Bacillus cihuensis TaxID=1208599 RepID=UPI000401B101|nr:hypothetical protein [Bacillus cihuensis]